MTTTAEPFQLPESVDVERLCEYLVAKAKNFRTGFPADEDGWLEGVVGTTIVDTMLVLQGTLSVEDYRPDPQPLVGRERHLNRLVLPGRIRRVWRLFTAATKPCIGRDPTCPCQDGDACHYVDLPGSPAMPIPPRP